MQRIRLMFLLVILVGLVGWMGLLLAPRLVASRSSDQVRQLLELQADLVTSAWKTEGLMLEARSQLLASGVATERFLLASQEQAVRAAETSRPPGPARAGTPAVLPRAQPARTGALPAGSTTAAAADPELLSRAALDLLPKLPGEQVALLNRTGQVLARRDNIEKQGDSLMHYPPVQEALQLNRCRSGLVVVTGGRARAAACPIQDATGGVLGVALIQRRVDREMAAGLANLVQGRPVALLADQTILATSLAESIVDEVRVKLPELLTEAQQSFGVERRSKPLLLQLRGGAALQVIVVEPGEQEAGLRLLLFRDVTAPPVQSMVEDAMELALANPTDPQLLLLGGLGLLTFLCAWLLIGLAIGLPCRKLARDLQTLGHAPDSHPLTIRSYPDFLKPVVVEAQIAVDAALRLGEGNIRTVSQQLKVFTDAVAAEEQELPGQVRSGPRSTPRPPQVGADPGSGRGSTRPPLPSPTGKPSVVAAEPPVTTARPPVAVVEPPVTTARPPVAVVEPPVTTTRPPVAVVEPPVTTTRPPVAVVEPPVTTARVESASTNEVSASVIAAVGQFAPEAPDSEERPASPQPGLAPSVVMVEPEGGSAQPAAAAPLQEAPAALFDKPGEKLPERKKVDALSERIDQLWQELKLEKRETLTPAQASPAATTNPSLNAGVGNRLLAGLKQELAPAVSEQPPGDLPPPAFPEPAATPPAEVRTETPGLETLTQRKRTRSAPAAKEGDPESPAAPRTRTPSTRRRRTPAPKAKK